MNAETGIPGAALTMECPLQWGRVLMNAETPGAENSPDVTPERLQWGRVLMNAETSRIARIDACEACFNGAAFS